MNGRYNPPSYQTLYNRVRKLQDDYRAKKTWLKRDAGRYQQIALIQAFQKAPPAVLLGAMIYIKKSIELGYNWSKDLLTLLNDDLDISATNQLDNKSSLTYLIAFSNYIKDKGFKLDGSQKEGCALLYDDVISIMKPIRLNEPEIEKLLNTPPTQNKVKQGLTNIAGEYKEICPQPPSLPVRLIWGDDSFEKRLWTVTANIAAKLLDKQQKEKEYGKPPEEKEAAVSANTVLGFLYFIMISQEQKPHIRDLKNTDEFYKKASQLANVDHTATIDDNFKKKCIAKFLAFVSEAIDDPTMLKEFADEFEIQFKGQDVPDAEGFLISLRERLNAMMINSSSYATAELSVLKSTAESTWAQWLAAGVLTASAEAVAGSAVGYANMAKVATLMLQPQYAIALLAVVYVLQQPVRTAVIYKTGSYLLSTSKAACYSLSSRFFSTPKKSYRNKTPGVDSDYVAVLLSAPDAIISKDEKEKLAKVIDSDFKPSTGAFESSQAFDDDDIMAANQGPFALTGPA